MNFWAVKKSKVYLRLILALTMYCITAWSVFYLNENNNFPISMVYLSWSMSWNYTLQLPKSSIFIYKCQTSIEKVIKHFRITTYCPMNMCILARVILIFLFSYLVILVLCHQFTVTIYSESHGHPINCL